METADLKVDGNAVAGMLREVFAQEMTIAIAVCDYCGHVGEIGSLMVYDRGPGVVMRCPSCGETMIRVVHGTNQYWLDLRGVRSVEIPSPAWAQ